MNEWLTVITSSPGWTPSTRSARCKAAVQFDTAHACGAPTYAANSRSNAATSGPCVSQPLRSGRAAASTSSSPTQGDAMGIFVRTPVAVGFIVSDMDMFLSRHQHLLTEPRDLPFERFDA